MAYIIQYNSELNRKYPQSNQINHLKRNSIIVIALLLLVIIEFSPVKDWILEWILPLNFHSVSNAFSKFISGCKEGETFSHWIIVFSRDILANG